jgi:hypothetical protein
MLRSPKELKERFGNEFDSYIKTTKSLSENGAKASVVVTGLTDIFGLSRSDAIDIYNTCLHFDL